MRQNLPEHRLIALRRTAERIASTVAHNTDGEDGMKAATDASFEYLAACASDPRRKFHDPREDARNAAIDAIRAFRAVENRKYFVEGSGTPMLELYFDKLSDLQRQATLLYLQGFTTKEVAAQMYGTRVGAQQLRKEAIASIKRAVEQEQAAARGEDQVEFAPDMRGNWAVRRVVA